MKVSHNEVKGHGLVWALADSLGIPVQFQDSAFKMFGKGNEDVVFDPINDLDQASDILGLVEPVMVRRSEDGLFEANFLEEFCMSDESAIGSTQLEAQFRLFLARAKGESFLIPSALMRDKAYDKDVRVFPEPSDPDVKTIDVFMPSVEGGPNNLCLDFMINGKNDAIALTSVRKVAEGDALAMEFEPNEDEQTAISNGFRARVYSVLAILDDAVQKAGKQSFSSVSPKTVIDMVEAKLLDSAARQSAAPEM
jgi:hypothetical protein